MPFKHYRVAAIALPTTSPVQDMIHNIQPIAAITALSSRARLAGRNAVILIAVLLGASFWQVLPGSAQTIDDVLSEDLVLRDPDIPAAGNRDGDITIVEYFDFQCPYCRKTHPILKEVIKEDGKVRLVSKDWPVFGGVSIYAAKMTLAAKYQGKFVEAHDALIEAKTGLTEPKVRQLLTKAGVDVDRAIGDLAANAKAIDAILARNNTQAQAFGFLGTPAFIVGKFRVAGGLDAAGFKQAIADARKADAQKK